MESGIGFLLALNTLHKKDEEKTFQAHLIMIDLL